MGLFRRRPRGRHVLGAAVTSLPSRPVAAPAPAPPAAVEAVAEPDLLTSIAQLIASGEAWNEPTRPIGVRIPGSASGPAPMQPMDDVAPSSAGPTPVRPDVPSQVTFLGGATGVAPADAAEERSLPACGPRSAAVAHAPVAVPVQARPRVELGFRDGTTASLDPDSEQAVALAELSQMLNARD
jgi:hypothetical protein